MKNLFIVSFVILWALVALCMFDIKNIKEDLSFKQQEIDQAGIEISDLVVARRFDCADQYKKEIISYDTGNDHERSLALVLIK